MSTTVSSPTQVTVNYNGKSITLNEGSDGTLYDPSDIKDPVGSVGSDGTVSLNEDEWSKLGTTADRVETYGRGGTSVTAASGFTQTRDGDQYVYSKSGVTATAVPTTAPTTTSTPGTTPGTTPGSTPTTTTAPTPATVAGTTDNGIPSGVTATPETISSRNGNWDTVYVGSDNNMYYKDSDGKYTCIGDVGGTDSNGGQEPEFNQSADAKQVEKDLNITDMSNKNGMDVSSENNGIRVGSNQYVGTVSITSPQNGKIETFNIDGDGRLYDNQGNFVGVVNSDHTVGFTTHSGVPEQMGLSGSNPGSDGYVTYAGVKASDPQYNTPVSTPGATPGATTSSTPSTVPWLQAYFSRMYAMYQQMTSTIGSFETENFDD